MAAGQGARAEPCFSAFPVLAKPTIGRHDRHHIDGVAAHAFPSLFLFSILYGGMVVLAGVLGNKQVALGSWLAVEAGIFAFLLLVALSSAVSELHGQSVANRLVLWGSSRWCCRSC